jgi:hypothetical protein
MNDVVIPPRPPQIHEAVRLANESLEFLLAAIQATESDSDLQFQFDEAYDTLCSAIGYMTAVPELEYLGQHIHEDQS